LKYRVARTAFLITLILLFSRLLGFVRDVVMAAVFGATHVTDAFVMAQSINGVFTVMLIGALGTTFIPVYSDVLAKRDEPGRRRFLDSLYTSTFAIAALLSLLVVVFSKSLVRLFAPEFSAADVDLTSNLSLVLVPFILMTLAVTLDTALLQVHGSFLVPAAIGFPSNVVLIAGMLLLAPGMGVYSLALSTVVASAAQLAMLWFARRKLKMPYRPRWDRKDEDLRRVGVLVLPVLLGSGINQIYTLIDRVLASGLPAGSIAALAYSNKLSLFVQGLASASIVSVFYTQMASHAAAGDEPEFKVLLRKSLGVLLLLLLPTTAALVALRVPLIQLIYQRGAFDASATATTATALLFYAVGLAAYSLREVLNRSFYARKDTKTPMINGLLSVVVNIALALFLTPRMGVGGLALAASGASIFSAATLGIRLYRKIGDFGLVHLGVVTLKIAAASAATGVAAFGTYALAHGATGSNAASLVAATGVGVLLYAGLVLLFRVEEAHKLVELVVGRLKKQKPVPEMPTDPNSTL
jgi:putative peptidoglycan lipid II flippase